MATGAMLGGLGHLVVQASDGLAAFILFQNLEWIDLVVSDLALPGMKGDELRDRCLALREVPVVLTHWGPAPRRTPSGIYLPAPYDAVALAAAITQASAASAASAIAALQRGPGRRLPSLRQP